MTDITLGGRRYTIKREWLHKTRAIFRFTGNTFARGFKWRRRLMPLYLLGMAVFAGVLCSAAPQSVQSAVFTSLCAAVTAAVWMTRRKRAERPLKRRERGYVLGNLGVGSVLLLLMAKLGPFTPPVPGLLLVWFVGGLGMPWWWYYRIRPVEEAPLMLKEDRERLWDENMAAQGSMLPRSELTEVRDIKGVEGAWTSRVELHDIRQTTDSVISKTVNIAAMYKVPLSSVVVEHDETGSENAAVLSIYTRNPLQEINYWSPDTFDPETGISKVGVYADGEPVEYQHFRRGSGPVHTLISGSTDSGKSKFAEQLLAIERHSGGLFVSVISDPQRGQSLPNWQDNVSFYADTPMGGVIEILVMKDLMYGRNERYGKLVWKDDKGRIRKGKGFFDPGRVEDGGDPIYSLTADEVHVTLAAHALAVQAAEEIGGMSRKCGGKIRFITQMPILKQIGNSHPLRDALASGNVFCFRTASGITGQVVFQGSFSVSPHKIKKNWPGVKDPKKRMTSGLGYALGAQARPSIMRTSLIEDPFHWATAGKTQQLGEADQRIVDLSREKWTEFFSKSKEGSRRTVHAVPDLAGADDSSYRQLILDFLNKKKTSTTGVIALAVGAKMPTAATTLKRLVDDGFVTKDARGTWSAVMPDDEADEETSEEEETEEEAS